MKVFRIIGRSIRDSFKSVYRNLSLSMASIICTTITLILVALAIILSSNVNYMTKSLEGELTILVYLDRETTSDEAKTIENKIKAMSKVKDTVYKSKEEWKLEMKNYSDTLNTTLDYLEKNPLLDSFVVMVNDVEDLKPVSKDIEKIDKVESANYGEGMVEDIVGVFNVIKIVTYVMVISLIVVTAFLISNTIKLTIFSRRNEIEIMRLVGSSNISIKLPFMFEGLLLGVVGAILPIILTVYGYFILFEKLTVSPTFEILNLLNPVPFVFYTSILLVIIGAVVGMFGSLRAVRKYLKI